MAKKLRYEFSTGVRFSTPNFRVNLSRGTVFYLLKSPRFVYLSLTADGAQKLRLSKDQLDKLLSRSVSARSAEVVDITRSKPSPLTADKAMLSRIKSYSVSPHLYEHRPFFKTKSQAMKFLTSNRISLEKLLVKSMTTVLGSRDDYAAEKIKIADTPPDLIRVHTTVDIGRKRYADLHYTARFVMSSKSVDHKPQPYLVFGALTISDESHAAALNKSRLAQDFFGAFLRMVRVLKKRHALTFNAPIGPFRSLSSTSLGSGVFYHVGAWL